MAGIIPTSGAGGVVIRDAGGECLELVTPPANAYCPGASFTTTCQVRYLPSDCDARITPAQINAFESELLCFAETLNPEGNWNCGSLCNLSANFTQWLTSDAGYEGSYLRVLQDHLCARPFISDLAPFPEASMIICDGEGNIARAAIPTGGGGGGGGFTSYVTDVDPEGLAHKIGTLSAPGTDVYESATTLTLEETVPGDWLVTYTAEGGTEYSFNLPNTGGGIPDAPVDGSAYVRKDAAWVLADVLTISGPTGDYTLVGDDAQTVIQMSGGSASVLTVPENDDVPFPVGTSIIVMWYGTGAVSVDGDGATIIHSPETLNLRKRFSMATLLKTQVNTWVISGDLELI